MHTIKDPQAALSRGDDLLTGVGAPLGTRVIQFYLSQDRVSATCLWQGNSILEIADYVNSVLGDTTVNTFFRVDEGHSFGLPIVTGGS
jgi:hypothetical protein